MWVENISIHAPRVGRDGQKHARSMAGTDFNPRAPCGARPGSGRNCVCHRAISIHAPRVGRDKWVQKASYENYVFQSTRPVWGATKALVHSFYLLFLFQSTRPVWGATVAGSEII